MNEADISAALGQMLFAVVGLPPIIWENKNATPPVPYLFAQVVRVGRTDPTLSGGMLESTGIFAVTVVSSLNVFTAPAETIADIIAGAFPKGLRITSTEGQVLIRRPPEILSGYPDGVHWRIPVQIPYAAQ